MNNNDKVLKKISKAKKFLKGAPSKKIVSLQVSILKKLATQGSTEALIELAIEHYRGNYHLDPKVAFKVSLAAARRGDARCMLNVGYSYSEGMGVKTNFRNALIWYKKAASEGLPEAQYNLALHYEKGHGVSQNAKLAFKYYKLAARYNDPEFNLSLGWCYEHGFGTKVNFKKSILCYKKSAKKGDAVAFFNLGLMRYFGNGVPANGKIALKYFEESKKRGFKKSQVYINKITRNS